MPPRKRGRDDRTPPPEPAPLPPPDLPASDLEFPSDALTALLLLRAHWAADTFGLVKRVKVAAADDEDDEATTLPPTCPILLRSQVAALVTDRDAADVELDELRRRNILRTLRLQLPTAATAYAFVSDFSAAVAAAAAAASPQTGAAAATALAAALPSLRSAGPIDRHQLLHALADDDAHVAALLRCGALARGDGDTFLLAPPAAGPFLTALRSGRALIARTLARKRYRQADERDVVAALVRAPAPRLGPRFLIRDAVGSGAVVRLRAPGGDVLRLP